MKKHAHALALSALLLAAACDNAGEHQNPDSTEGGSTRTDPTAMDSATQGTSIPATPPPVGSVTTTPADSGSFPNVPDTQATGGAAPADTGAPAQP